MISWEVDVMGVDLVGIDLTGVDLAAANPQVSKQIVSAYDYIYPLNSLKHPFH